MGVCDCCRRDRPDVKDSGRLCGVDRKGNSSAQGPLYNDCLARETPVDSDQPTSVGCSNNRREGARKMVQSRR
jgi:hypothetical protein